MDLYCRNNQGNLLESNNALILFLWLFCLAPSAVILRGRLLDSCCFCRSTRESLNFQTASITPRYELLYKWKREIMQSGYKQQCDAKSAFYESENRPNVLKTSKKQPSILEKSEEHVLFLKNTWRSKTRRRGRVLHSTSMHYINKVTKLATQQPSQARQHPEHKVGCFSNIL